MQTLRVSEVEEDPWFINQGLSRDPMIDEPTPFPTLTVDELSNLPDPSWLIEGILPASSLVTLFGAPGSTKSFWALDAACSIAAGFDFHGKKSEKGSVVYCVGEGLSGMKWRIEAWCLAHPEADIEALKNNLVIVPQAPHLLEKEDSRSLAYTASRVAEKKGGLSCLIVDTWARSLTGGDENSAQDAGTAIDRLDRIRSSTGATPIVVHHTGADGTRERGSTALRGASDTSLMMEMDESTRIVTMTCRKSKDAERFYPIRYKLSPYGKSVVLEINGATWVNNGDRTPF
jgi:RecA-family ATPase